MKVFAGENRFAAAFGLVVYAAIDIAARFAERQAGGDGCVRIDHRR